MHHQRIGLGKRELFGIQSEIAEIFFHRGHKRTIHPLALQTQHHHNVGVLQPFAHIGENFCAHILDADRQQCRGANNTNVSPQRVEKDKIGACDARMENVAANRHNQPANTAFISADGECIQQRLRRVLMLAIARIDHRAIDFTGQKLHGAG